VSPLVGLMLGRATVGWATLSWATVNWGKISPSVIYIALL
jgi:hypothetical protein